MVVVLLVAGPHVSTGQSADTPLTLAVALAQARARSAARHAAEARVEAADLSRSVAGRLPNPVVEGRWENWAGPHDRLPYDLFATVTQVVELGGKRAARVGIAGAVADGARAALDATGRELDLEVARRFFLVVRERDRGRLLTDHARGLAELVRVLERRVAEGTAAEADLRKLETERGRVETDALRGALRAVRELAPLAALTGWLPLPDVDRLQPPAPPAASPLEVEARIAASLDRRHDVRVATARLEAARQALRFELARRVPDLAVTAGLKRTGGYDTGVLSVLTPIPIFDRNRAASILARGGVVAAERELDQVRLRAAGEARAALIAASALADQHAQADARLIVPATLVRSATRAAFESGVGDILRLVDAERVYAEARMAVYELGSEAVAAAIEARLALAEEVVP